MQRILILGVASVQLEAIELLKTMGYEVHALAMAKDGPGADAADFFECINILDIENVQKYIETHQIDAVYSVGNDLAIPVAAELSEKLKLPYFVTKEVANICNRKSVLRETLGTMEGNLPFVAVSSLEDALKQDYQFPCMMKPTDAQGQRGIFKVNSLDDISKNFDVSLNASRQKRVIIERFAEGVELSVNLYLLDGRVVFLLASDRATWPQFTGLIHQHILPSTKLTKLASDRLERLCEKAAERIGIKNGPAYFQVMLEEETPYIIEATPRLDGCHMWRLIHEATGFNLLKLSFEHLLLKKTDELQNWTEKYKAMRLVFFCQEPNTIMDQSIFKVPNKAIYHFFYYETGDEIRAINGRYEKVGFYIIHEDDL